MPYINVKTNVKLDDMRRQTIMEKVTKSITLIPGKSESHLMCSVDDGAAMMFHGDSASPIAIVEVKIFGRSTKDAYAALTKELCGIMKDEAGVDGENCYVKYDEVENWGMNGFMF